MSDYDPLDMLALALEEAKSEEANARDRRIHVENQIIAAVGLKEEGSTTVKTTWYKVTTTQSLTRTFDPEADIPLDLLRQVTRVKSELDVTALKNLATSDPAAYAIVARGIVTKPAKPAVKIERIES